MPNRSDSLPDPSTPSLENAPQVIAGRYEVIGLLGVGGMGAVYKVRDRELDEVIALKMLKREIAGSPGIVERFRREVKLARRVTHPNVARTFDLGEHEGERFLTMELVEGESLATIAAREGQLPLARVVEYVSSICAGLDAAHTAGIVHRDLKPDNVMIARNSGRVVITDFGIARAQEAGAASRTAVPVGTPAYMSPEQVEASANIDGRADIYALGAMMFELLSGHLPFEADSVFAIAAMRLTQPPPDPRTYRADLPEPVALLVQRCMARRPDDRPQSAREIAARLGSLTVPDTESLAKTAQNPVVTSTDGSQKTVAVLPFRNAGPPADDYLVDGLTDDLIDTLSMTPGLRVRPRGAVMQLKDPSSDPRELGRSLRVQVVVEGTMRTTPDAIRVSARVLSVEDGFQIWAKRFEGTRAHVLRIGDDAARAIADALAVRKPTRAAIMTDPVAVDLYLRGRHEYMKFWAEANARAVKLLASAHERAPQDPLIMSGYAAALARHVGFDEVTGSQVLARDIAEKAVRIAPKLAEAQTALALVRWHEPDLVGAAACVVKALSLSPLLPDAHELRTRLLAEVGDAREAIASAERTMQLEPRLMHLRYTVIARAYVELGEIDDAKRVYASPPDDTDLESLFWLMRFRMAMWQRDSSEARVILGLVEGREFASLPVVRVMCKFLEDREVSALEWERLTARASSTNHSKRNRVFWYQLRTELTCLLDKPDLSNIEEAVKLGLYDIAWMDRCPLLSSLRGIQRYKELRGEVATRATRTLMELRGGEATLAS